MISITRADGTRVRVVFSHHQMKVERGQAQQPIIYLHPERKRNRGPIRAVTYAILEGGTKDAPMLFATGKALCSMLDGFEKETGRQLALTDVLATALCVNIITDDERGMLLASYFNRPRGTATTLTTTTSTGAPISHGE